MADSVGVGSNATRIAYCPTLRSPGGLAAAAHLYAKATGSMTPPDIMIAPSLPTTWEGRVELLSSSGHIEGYRLAESIARGEPVSITCLQNPALLRRRWRAVSVVQNHAALHGFIAIRFSRRWRERIRFLALVLGSALQLARSERWYSLNSSVPRPWNAIGLYVGSLSNRSLRQTDADAHAFASAADGKAATPPLLLWVGSLDGFRRPDLMLDVCALLPAELFRAVLRARSADRGIEQEARRRIERLRQTKRDVTLVIDGLHEDVLTDLQRSTAAVFTSLIEGSPVAFIEACRHAPAVVAPDVPHYRESIPGDARARLIFLDHIDAQSISHVVGELLPVAGPSETGV